MYSLTTDARVNDVSVDFNRLVNGPSLFPFQIGKVFPEQPTESGLLEVVRHGRESALMRPRPSKLLWCNKRERRQSNTGRAERLTDRGPFRRASRQQSTYPLFMSSNRSSVARPLSPRAWCASATRTWAQRESMRWPSRNPPPARRFESCSQGTGTILALRFERENLSRPPELFDESRSRDHSPKLPTSRQVPTATISADAGAARRMRTTRNNRTMRSEITPPSGTFANLRYCSQDKPARQASPIDPPLRLGFKPRQRSRGHGGHCDAQTKRIMQRRPDAVTQPGGVLSRRGLDLNAHLRQ